MSSATDEARIHTVCCQRKVELGNRKDEHNKGNLITHIPIKQKNSIDQMQEYILLNFNAFDIIEEAHLY
jgi:hypothetical protein